MIIKSAFGNTIRLALSKVFKESYLYNDYGGNWLYRLLVRLKLRKAHRTMVPGAFPKLFKPSLQKNLEEAKKAESFNWKDER
jgi:hypothetical protein